MMAPGLRAQQQPYPPTQGTQAYGSGREHIFTTNFSDDTSSLYRNEGNGQFAWAIPDAGLEWNTHYLGWGTMFFDPDNRGVLDLVVTDPTRAIMPKRKRYGYGCGQGNVSQHANQRAGE